jgi:hypothetical protein
MYRIKRRLIDLLAKVSQTSRSFALTNKSFAIQLLFQTFLFAVRVRLQQKQLADATRNAEIVVNQGNSRCRWRKSMPAPYHYK